MLENSSIPHKCTRHQQPKQNQPKLEELQVRYESKIIYFDSSTGSDTEYTHSMAVHSISGE